MPAPYRNFSFAFVVSLALAACVFSIGPGFGENVASARLTQAGPSKSVHVDFTRLEAKVTLQNRDLSTLKGKVRLLVRDLDIEVAGVSDTALSPREIENRLSHTAVIDLHLDSARLSLEGSDPTRLAGTVRVEGLAQRGDVPASVKASFEPVIQPADSPFGRERLVLEGRLQLAGSILGEPGHSVSGDDRSSLMFRLVLEPVGKSGREFVARTYPGL